MRVLKTVSTHGPRRDESKINQIKAIKAAQKQLGMDDDTYRAMLVNLAGVDSSTKLDFAGRMRVLDFLNGRSVRKVFVQFANTDDPERGKLLKKIGAMLSNTDRNADYGHAMAKRMFKIDRVEWLAPKQLCGLIGELEQDQRRRERRNGDSTNNQSQRKNSQGPTGK
ncbi:MAG: regulatory protein GemA [Candidatus Riflebacteria bacterium]|nr:regulatory protein GemA [Candidatus Riflebacteria bacterium]